MRCNPRSCGRSLRRVCSLFRSRRYDVGIGADCNRAFSREQSEHLRGGGRSQLDEAIERDAVLDDAAVVYERHSMLDAGRAVRDFGEIVASQLLLLLHAERAVVGRDDLQVVRLQALPKFRLIRLFAKRRRHHVLRALEVVAVIFNREEKILRAGFGERGNATVARLAHLIKRVGATEVNDIDGRFGHLGNRDRAMYAFGFGDRRARQRVIFRRGSPLRERAFDYFVDDDAVLGVHANQPAALARRATSREKSSHRPRETRPDTP